MRTAPSAQSHLLEQHSGLKTRRGRFCRSLGQPHPGKGGIHPSPRPPLFQFGGDAGILLREFSTERDPPLQGPSIGYCYDPFCIMSESDKGDVEERSGWMHCRAMMLTNRDGCRTGASPTPPIAE